MSEYVTTVGWTYDAISASYVGFHAFIDEDGEEYGSFEVFCIRSSDYEGKITDGWYWWPCFPGCLPDGDTEGPFETPQAAFIDARES